MRPHRVIALAETFFFAASTCSFTIFGGQGVLDRYPSSAAAAPRLIRRCDFRVPESPSKHSGLPWWIQSLLPSSFTVAGLIASSASKSRSTSHLFLIGFLRRGVYWRRCGTPALRCRLS